MDEKLTVRQLLEPHWLSYHKAKKEKINCVFGNIVLKPLIPLFKTHYPNHYIDVIGVHGLFENVVDIWLWTDKKDIYRENYPVSKVLTLQPSKDGKMILMAELKTHYDKIDAVNVIDWPVKKLLNYFNEIKIRTNGNAR